MRDGSRLADLLVGGAVGLMLGLVVKELDLTTLVSFFGERNYVVIACAIVCATAWLTRLRRVVAAAAVSAALLWLAVGFTPLTAFMARDLVRQDPLAQSDAVFVLASSLQDDSELTTSAMSRLLHGLELLGEGWAERLVLTELSEPVPRYREAACAIMDRLGLENEVIALGPVRNTHDEAVLVAELARDYGFERLLVVTSPSHSRRAERCTRGRGRAGDLLSFSADPFRPSGPRLSGNERRAAPGIRTLAPRACRQSLLSTSGLDRMMETLQTLEREFPAVIELPVAWGEMDAMGHVNNVVYFRYFESARLAYFERVGFLAEMKRSGIGPILRSTRCDFRQALTYPDRIWVGASAGELGDDRCVMRYRIVSESSTRVAAEGDGLVVAYDYRALKKATLPEAIRENIESLEATRGG